MGLARICCRYTVLYSCTENFDSCLGLDKWSPGLPPPLPSLSLSLSRFTFSAFLGCPPNKKEGMKVGGEETNAASFFSSVDLFWPREQNTLLTKCAVFLNFKSSERNRKKKPTLLLMQGPNQKVGWKQRRVTALSACNLPRSWQQTLIQKKKDWKRVLSRKKKGRTKSYVAFEWVSGE